MMIPVLNSTKLTVLTPDTLITSLNRVSIVVIPERLEKLLTVKLSTVVPSTVKSEIVVTPVAFKFAVLSAVAAII